jgi:hypothetical protein
MRTKPSTVLAAVSVQATSCYVKKEVVLMKHAIRVFVNRHRLLLALLMIVTVVLVLVLASMVNGVGYYLISVAVLLGMGIGVGLLLVRVVKRFPGGHDISDWWQ